MNRHRQKGIILPELLLLVLVVLVVAGAVYLAIRHKSAVSSSVSASTSPAATVSPSASTAPSGWLVYHSSVSGATFSYPANWTVQKYPTAQPLLEEAVVRGPQGFDLWLQISREHANTGASCARSQTSIGTPVSVSSQYDMVPEQNGGQVYDVYLIDKQQAGSLSNSGCGLGWVNNPLGSSMTFTFEGVYQLGGNGSRALTTQPKPAAGFYDLPEVAIARQVMASFKP